MNANRSVVELDINLLEFDPHNPRLPKKYQEREEAAVIDWMLQDASLLDLMSSIALNGYFYGEPIFVIRKENSGKYIVIEGNRRLAAVKLLNNPSLAKIKTSSIQEILSDNVIIPQQLPAFILDSREQLIDYLGFRHITGVKSWGALLKARYLFRLYEHELSKSGSKDVYKTIAKHIGSKATYVRQIIVAYKLYLIIEDNAFFKIPDLEEETFEFSLLYGTATKYSNIIKFINIDFEAFDEIGHVNKRNLRDLTSWLFQKNNENVTRVAENREFPLLNMVVASDKALESFRRGEKNLKEAAEMTGFSEDIFTEFIKKSANNLLEAQRILAQIDNVHEGNVTQIKTVVRLSQDIYATVNNRLLQFIKI